MLNAIQQGIFTSSTKERLDELEATKGDLELKILQEQIGKPLWTEEQLTYWICRFRDLDMTIQEQRQRLVDMFVNSVYVYDDHAVITFNYRDGTKTISLREIEGSGLGSSLSCLGAPQRNKTIENTRFSMVFPYAIHELYTIFSKTRMARSSSRGYR